MNNRQPSRRRGRSNNNNRPQGNNNRGGVDSANRIDNRARGNASQLLEKYKKLASDAQLNDDGVNAENYLQYADHYFRVLADSKARQEEQRKEREEREGAREASNNDRGGERNDNRGERNERGGRNDRDDSEARDDNREERPRTQRPRNRNENSRDERPDGGRKNEEVSERVQENAQENDGPKVEVKAKPRRARKPAKPVASDDMGDGLDLAALPPAIGTSDVDGEEAVVEKKPVRKPRVKKLKPVEEAPSAAAEG